MGTCTYNDIYFTNTQYMPRAPTNTYILNSVANFNKKLAYLIKLKANKASYEQKITEFSVIKCNIRKCSHKSFLEGTVHRKDSTTSLFCSLRI